MCVCEVCFVNTVKPWVWHCWPTLERRFISSAPSASSWSFWVMTSGKTTVMCCQLFWLVLSQRTHHPFLRHFLQPAYDHFITQMDWHITVKQRLMKSFYYNDITAKQITEYNDIEIINSCTSKCDAKCHCCVFRESQRGPVVRNGCKMRQSFQQLAAAFQTSCGSTQTQ